MRLHRLKYQVLKFLPFFFGKDCAGLKLYYLIMIVYGDQKLLQLGMFWSKKAEASKLVVVSSCWRQNIRSLRFTGEIE